MREKCRSLPATQFHFVAGSSGGEDEISGPCAKPQHRSIFMWSEELRQVAISKKTQIAQLLEE